jgi:hypothetical protein
MSLLVAVRPLRREPLMEDEPADLWIYLLTNRCFFAILHTVLARGRPMPLDQLRELIALLGGGVAAASPLARPVQRQAAQR